MQYIKHVETGKYYEYLDDRPYEILVLFKDNEKLWLYVTKFEWPPVDKLPWASSLAARTSSCQENACEHIWTQSVLESPLGRYCSTCGISSENALRKELEVAQRLLKKAHTMDREELLVELISCGTGYEIDLFGMLYLRPLENGEFAVGCDDSAEPNWEKCFKDPKEAARLFEQVRKERELGFEFEGQSR